MTPVQRFLRSARVRAAHERHRNNPMMLQRLPRHHTPIETTLPDADAREQIGRLNRAGVACLSVTKTSAGTRVVYAMPLGVRLG